MHKMNGLGSLFLLHQIKARSRDLAAVRHIKAVPLIFKVRNKKITAAAKFLICRSRFDNAYASNSEKNACSFVMPFFA